MTMGDGKTLLNIARSDPRVIVSFFALLLFLVFLFEVRPSNAAIQRQHDEMRSEMIAIENKHDVKDAEMRAFLGAVRDAMKESAYLQFRNCVNTAQSAEARERCIYKQ